MKIKEVFSDNEVTLSEYVSESSSEYSSDSDSSFDSDDDMEFVSFPWPNCFEDPTPRHANPEFPFFVSPNKLAFPTELPSNHVPEFTPLTPRAGIPSDLLFPVSHTDFPPSFMSDTQSMQRPRLARRMGTHHHRASSGSMFRHNEASTEVDPNKVLKRNFLIDLRFMILTKQWHTRFGGTTVEKVTLLEGKDTVHLPDHVAQMLNACKDNDNLNDETIDETFEKVKIILEDALQGSPEDSIFAQLWKMLKRVLLRTQTTQAFYDKTENDLNGITNNLSQSL